MIARVVGWLARSSCLRSFRMIDLLNKGRQFNYRMLLSLCLVFFKHVDLSLCPTPVGWLARSSCLRSFRMIDKDPSGSTGLMSSISLKLVEEIAIPVSQLCAPLEQRASVQLSNVAVIVLGLFQALQDDRQRPLRFNGLDEFHLSEAGRELAIQKLSL
jgi:hypothetical protein